MYLVILSPLKNLATSWSEACQGNPLVRTTRSSHRGAVSLLFVKMLRFHALCVENSLTFCIKFFDVILGTEQYLKHSIKKNNTSNINTYIRFKLILSKMFIYS